jgi:hypothetical protein
MQLALLNPGPYVAALGRKLGPAMLAASALAVIFAVLAFG